MSKIRKAPTTPIIVAAAMLGAALTTFGVDASAFGSRAGWIKDMVTIGGQAPQGRTIQKHARPPQWQRTPHATKASSKNQQECKARCQAAGKVVLEQKLSNCAKGYKDTRTGKIMTAEECQAMVEGITKKCILERCAP